MQWDSFKAWVRGAYISRIAQLQRESSRTLEQLEEEAAEREADFVLLQTADGYKLWLRALHRVENTKKAMFYTRERIFEYGDKNSQFLNMVTRMAICWPGWLRLNTP